MLARALVAGLLFAAALRAEIALGSTRDEVIAQFGPPRGTTKAGDREILVYADGRVVLESGRVTELLRPSSAAAPARAAPPAPAPAPAAPASLVDATAQRTQALAEVTAAMREPWHTDFETAKAAAAKENKRILALFTGTDWCGPCQAFQAEVAYNADFLEIFSSSFVFLKVNWLRNTPQPKAQAEQVAALRQRYGIATYPSLLVLAPDGTRLARVDTSKGRQASSLADFYIQAIDEARQATRDGRSVKSSWWPF